ncbi:MAG: ABC transporter permease [Actinomycetota bacterium]|nr:ABC transporter permease [Actinomycetota bacterium]
MSAFAGTSTFIRFFLRRDRLAMMWWILGGVILYWSQAVSVKGLYATQAEFDRAAASMDNNAALIAMAGPARVLNTVGGQVAWQASAFGAILAGLMSMFLIGRHTRVEEESGREEMIRAGVVGRYATVSAAVVVVSLANVILGLGIAGSLIAYGLPAAGSISLGLAATLAGLVFMGVALVAAQLTEGARAMYGITGAVIGLAYVLRAIGDIGNGFWSWLSPIGWGQAMRAYAGEIWWPALLSVAAFLVLGVIALRILDRRDVGAGVWPTRPGPAHGGASMTSAYGLAWRLQRGTVIGWTAGMFLMGLAYGSIGKDVGDLLGDSEFSKDVFAQGGGELVKSFYSTTALMLALIGSSFAISSAQRLRGEETSGRVEALLSTALTRRRWAASHAVVTLAGSALVVLAAGFGTGLSYGLIAGDGSQIWRLSLAALVHLPAVLILGGVTLVLVGFAPRLAAAGWIALVFCFVVMMFGELLKFPGWLIDVSPFVHLPLLPVQDFRLVPVVVEVAVAAGLALLAYTGLRRRDIS